MSAHFRSLLCALIAVCVGCSKSSTTPAVVAVSVSAAPTEAPVERRQIADKNRVYVGTRIEHEFEFVNDTAGVLQLDKTDGIRRSCGCTNATVSQHELQPGQSTKVLVSVSTAGKTDAFSDSVQIRWKTVDGSTLVSSFGLRGKLVPVFKFEPAEVVFGVEHLNQQQSIDVRIIPEVAVDWETLRVLPGAKGLECELLPAEPGQQFRMMRLMIVDDTVADATYASPVVRARPASANDDEEHVDGRLAVRLDLGGLPRLSGKSIRLTRREDGYEAQVFVKGRADFSQLQVMLKSPPTESGASADPVIHTVSRISDLLHRVVFVVPNDLIASSGSQPLSAELRLDERSLGGITLFH